MLDSAECAGFAGIRRSPSLLGLEHKLALDAVTGSTAWGKCFAVESLTGRRDSESYAVPAAQGYISRTQNVERKTMN
jgi:hypothetical protein